VAYRANSPLSDPAVRDKIIAAALDISARGGRPPDLVAEVNSWYDVDGVTHTALLSAWKRWRSQVTDLPMYITLFPAGQRAYRKVDARIDIPIDVDVSERERDDKTEPGAPPELLADHRISSSSGDADSPVAADRASGRDQGSALGKFALLIKAARTRPTFETLCDKLGLPPGRARQLVDEALAAGIQLDVAHGMVTLRRPEENKDPRPIQGVQVAPVVGDEQMVGVISDTHLGSHYCRREYLKDFINNAYDQGVREILHPGDILDGDYRHGKFEMSHMGITEQTRDLFETLPQRPGLSYHSIMGNHDWTFTEQSGVDVGEFIKGYFADRGRHDYHHYGARGAYLKLRGAVIHLWHPCGSASYAKSYKLQKKIESYAPGEKPDILLAGHWHFYCVLEERGVHAVACPTFQGGGSAFGKSLATGQVALGGVVLRWRLTEHGTLREFSATRHSYYLAEQPRRLETSR
jgi:predicted phosphodiesterase